MDFKTPVPIFIEVFKMTKNMKAKEKGHTNVKT